MQVKYTLWLDLDDAHTKDRALKAAWCMVQHMVPCTVQYTAQCTIQYTVQYSE